MARGQRYTLFLSPATEHRKIPDQGMSVIIILAYLQLYVYKRHAVAVVTLERQTTDLIPDYSLVEM